jgi:cell division protein FtsB
MKRLIEQRYTVRHNFLTILGLCLTVYFSWHIVAGERSMFRLISLNHTIEKVTTDYDREHVKREQLEAKVVKLRPGSIDPDLLEERARIVLGYARPDEHIVILPN